MRCRNCKQWITQEWPGRESRSWRHGRTGQFTCDVVPLWWIGSKWPMATPDESGRHAQALSLE